MVALVDGTVRVVVACVRFVAWLVVAFAIIVVLGGVLVSGVLVEGVLVERVLVVLRPTWSERGANQNNIDSAGRSRK